jgi:hypothetical protein
MTNVDPAKIRYEFSNPFSVDVRDQTCADIPSARCLEHRAARAERRPVISADLFTGPIDEGNRQFSGKACTWYKLLPDVSGLFVFT